MALRMIGAMISAFAAWYVIASLEQRSFGNGLLAALMVICTAIITYKIDQLRKTIKKDKDPEEFPKNEE